MKTVTLSELKAKHELFFKPKTLKCFGVQKKKVYKSDRLGCSVYVEKMLQKYSNNTSAIRYSARKINDDLTFAPVEYFDRLYKLELYVGKAIKL